MYYYSVYNPEGVTGSKNDPHKFLTIEVKPEDRGEFKKAQTFLMKNEKIHAITYLIQDRIILDEEHNFAETIPVDMDAEAKREALSKYCIFTKHVMPRFKAYANHGDVLAAEVARGNYTVESIIEPYIQWLLGTALADKLLTSEDCAGLNIL